MIWKFDLYLQTHSILTKYLQYYEIKANNNITAELSQI